MSRRTCRSCSRPCGYWLRGKQKFVSDDDHDLCPRCWKAAQDRARAQELQGASEERAGYDEVP